ncbi:testis-expressed protein 12-like isoform X3 [Notolabrus celidotus]|uniref:testis-expressed protein 12-like isoform X3 n=1 Tax=Notolabrus celidotus TaxID=1203425 RepID=UPI0014901763|nr:testis-expressed protein 12-like isoform X3 [Notolabrus celidotus]XP_034557155.1 testis-expressed protein 12-like isoform X3 [Notolabrus celidotus]XP_034557156.1 testis-expressed protein 12-like isoform X3 [Notolabrus celidotus]XP_034557157.1 testis-expressed protein 12-like isoform X3 [Notolabrus celidotus]
MEETTPMAGKLVPPTLNKRAVNIYNKSPKQATPQEFCNLLQQTERSSANPEKSPPKKKRPPSKPSMVEPADLFDATTAGASREVSMLFSKLAEVLSERATADTSQIKQLDGILRETQNLESYLREKKNHLRQKLALISNKLQG